MASEILMLLFLIVLVNSNIVYGQCPNILTTNISNTTLCPGDVTTITLTGENLPNGGTIDFYMNQTSGFNPYNNEGTYIGEAEITTPCAQGPTILFAMIDPPSGPDRCDEFIVIHSGSGLSNIDDISISSNIGFFNPYVPGNPNTFTGPCTPTIMNPGEPVPPNAIVIITGAYNTNEGETFDISNLCNKGLPIYVIASSNTTCGGGHFTNSGTHQYNVSTPCGNSEFTYSDADSWSNLSGGIIGITNVVADVTIPPYINSPSTISAFNYTIPSDFCDNNVGGTYYITGIINPKPSDFCLPLETTDEMMISIVCSDFDLTTATFCQNDPSFDLNNLIITTPIPTGTWTGNNGIVIIGSTINPATTAPGIYTLTFSPDDGCNDPKDTTIEIFETAVAEINAPVEICLEPGGSYVFTLSPASTSGGEWSISPSGFIDINTGELDFSSLQGGVTYTVTYSVSSIDCPGTVTDEVTFTPITQQTLDITLQDICELSTPIPLDPVQNGITGTWYYFGIPITSFDPEGNVGTTTLTFDPDPGQCAESVDVAVVVLAAITPTVDIESTVCESIGIIDLPFNPSGVLGSWSGNGVFGNTFDPSGLSGVITLTFTPDFGVCAYPIEHYIEIIATPVLINIQPINICLISGQTGVSLNLQDYENGLNGGQGFPIDWYYDFQLFNQITTPWDLYVTDDMVIYASTNVDGCPSEPLAVEINILDNYEIAITSESDPVVVCEGEIKNVLVYEVNGELLNYIWTSPSGENFTDPQITVTETGIYTVVGELDGCQSNTVTIEVIVPTPIEVESETITNATCAGNDGSVIVNFTGGYGNIEFDWADFPGNTSNTLLNLNPGEYDYTIVDESGCEYGPFSAVIGGASGSISVNILNGGLFCKGSAYSLELVLTEGDLPYELNYSIDGIPQTPIIINTTPYTFTIDEDEFNTEVLLTGVSKDNCPGALTGIPYIRIMDDLYFSNLVVTCDEENEIYQVSFDLFGGNDSGFIFTGTPNGEIINDNEFTSFNLPIGVSYEFSFTTLLGCDTLTVVGTDNCANECDLESGNMNTDLIVVCEGENINFNYLGGYNGVVGEDTLIYAIRNAAGMVVSRWNTTNLTWADISSLNPNTLYYFTPIATELDANGLPIYDSDCLTSGEATPFMYAGKSTATVTGGGELCHDEELLVIFNFESNAPYTINYSSDGVSRPEVLLTRNPDTLFIDHSISQDSFNLLSVTDEFGCALDIIDNTTDITRTPILQRGQITYECDVENGTYTFSFTITGGSSSNYIFLQGQGNINNGVYQSNPIPLGMPYTVRITDQSECSIVEVEVESELCEDCAIEAGVISGDPIEIFCANSAGNQIFVSRNHTGFSNNTGEFIRFYISTAYPITGPEDIIGVNDSPEFIINTPIPGLTYYIVGLANKTDDDTYDTSSECHDLTNVIEIRFQLNGRRNISVELCENDFYEFNGEIFDVNRPTGNFIFPGLAVNGCDSLVHIQLEFTDEFNLNYTPTLCFGESLVINGNEYNSLNPSGIERLNGVGQDCDTIMFIDLSFTNEIIATENYQICSGDSIQINGVYYSENNISGSHFFENGSQGGCDSTLNVNIDIVDLVLMANSFDADCPGSNNGTIMVFDPANHYSMFTFTLNGQTSSGTLPYNFDNLGAGTYQLTVSNNVCSWDTTLVINNSFEPEIVMPTSVNLQEGDNYQINLSTNLNPPYSINWAPATDLSCTDCINPVASPSSNTTYTVTLTSPNGCTATATIAIIIEKPDDKVFIPNAFTPNLDGVNDVFILYADRDYVLEYSMTIYNRWGDLMYKQDKLLPSIETNGWNGMFKGKLLNNGVYIYVIEAKISNSDRIKVYGGDINLIR